ncbi:hypothetical protein LTS18_002708, partial [Coniosporium uncinatum]
MATEAYEIDSDGDVLLILRNPRPSFAVWDDTQVHRSSLPDPASLDLVDEIFITEPASTKKEKREKRRGLDEYPIHVPEPPSGPFDESPSAPLDESPAPLDEARVIVECVEIIISSHHLTLASPYYARMLKGKWMEADTLRKNGCVEVEVEDVDADALVILMKIIHGKTRTVPRAVTLEMLAKIAVI